MAKIRLFGLVLIMTTMFLGLAAMVTQTMEIRLRRPGYGHSNSAPSSAAFETGEVEFISVPVFFPLGVAGVLGLVLWFLPEVLLPSKSNRQTGRRRRSRRRKSRFKVKL